MEDNSIITGIALIITFLMGPYILSFLGHIYRLISDPFYIREYKLTKEIESLSENIQKYLRTISQEDLLSLNEQKIEIDNETFLKIESGYKSVDITKPKAKMIKIMLFYKNINVIIASISDQKDNKKIYIEEDFLKSDKNILKEKTNLLKESFNNILQQQYKIIKTKDIQKLEEFINFLKKIETKDTQIFLVIQNLIQKSEKIYYEITYNKVEINDILTLIDYIIPQVTKILENYIDFMNKNDSKTFENEKIMEIKKTIQTFPDHLQKTIDEINNQHLNQIHQNTKIFNKQMS